MQILTSSRMRAFRRCARYHHLKYERMVERVGERGGALRVGSLFHRALAAWLEAHLGGHTAREALSWALTAIARHAQEEECDPFDVAKVRAMVRGYDARWGGEDRYAVKEIEREYRAPLRHPESGRRSRAFVLGGKVDAIVEDLEDGRVYVVEHKTTSEDLSPGSDYWVRLRIDSQISNYYEGAAALGYQVDGCIYDVAKRPGLRPLQANARRAQPEAPEEYEARCLASLAEAADGAYGRGVVIRLDEEMRSFRWDAWHTARLMRDAERLGMHPRNDDACNMFNRACEYLDVCAGVAPADDPVLYTVRARRHPELSSDEAQP
jgi:hypothetical protein